jgi:MSHA biogenesis protein MshK
MARRMNSLGACLTGLVTAYSAHCAPFADPTRPPSVSNTVGPAATAGPRLESVLIAPDRKIALINGRQYAVGAAFADGRVVRITETEVVIRRGGRDEVLKLFPQGGKRPSAEQEK